MLDAAGWRFHPDTHTHTQHVHKHGTHAAHRHGGPAQPCEQQKAVPPLHSTQTLRLRCVVRQPRGNMMQGPTYCQGGWAVQSTWQRHDICCSAASLARDCLMHCRLAEATTPHAAAPIGEPQQAAWWCSSRTQCLPQQQAAPRSTQSPQSAHKLQTCRHTQTHTWVHPHTLLQHTAAAVMVASSAGRVGARDHPPVPPLQQTLRRNCLM